MRQYLVKVTNKIYINFLIIIGLAGCFSPGAQYSGKTPQEVYKEADFMGFFYDGLGFVIKLIPVSAGSSGSDYLFIWILNYGNKPFELNYLSKVAYYIGKKKYYPDNFDRALLISSGSPKFINPGGYFFYAYSIDSIAIPGSVTPKITAIGFEPSLNGKREYIVPRRRINVQGEEYAKAISILDYNATNPNQLSFKAGDIFTIISVKYKDAGWLWCELNGKQGFVPDSYLEEIKIK